MIKKLTSCLIFFGLVILTVSIITACRSEKANPVSQYDVVWNIPGKDARGSMPIGNGDIGLNVWVEQDGDLLFYIGKIDSYDGHHSLLKLGRVRVNLSPNTLINANSFQQQLDLLNGQIVISAGKGKQAISLRIWVDANNPVIHVEAKSDSPFEAKVDLESWRTGPEEVALDSLNESVIWYHRNLTSKYPEKLKFNFVPELEGKIDPLIHRTFGGKMKGKGLISAKTNSLKSSANIKQLDLAIYVLTAQTENAEQWLEMLDEQVEKTEKLDPEDVWSAHKEWWYQFWTRSWINVTGLNDAFAVSQGYALQRFINACSCRGDYPPPYNGSIFNVDTKKGTYHYHAVPLEADKDADWRPWNGFFMWQNTRQIFGAMPASGDFGLMKSLFNLYTKAIPLARKRTENRFHHEGAYLTESMLIGGAEDLRPRHLEYLWLAGLECTFLMLEYANYTQDADFIKQTLLPFADQILTFYDQHYLRTVDNKINLYPRGCVESYSRGPEATTNPMTEVAGMRFVLANLLALPENTTTSEQRQWYSRMLREMPDLPLRQVAYQGKKTTLLAPAQRYDPGFIFECPELYAVEPFRQVSLFKPKLLDIARKSFELRGNSFDGSVLEFYETGGWLQHPITAARLGMTESAAKLITANFSNNYEKFRETNRDGVSWVRFPAFWGPNWDWVPDQTHGGTSMKALQAMILQADGEKMMLLPAWPKNWNVEFKLHAPFNTVVQGLYAEGKLQYLDVKPEERRKDIEILTPMIEVQKDKFN